MADQSNEMGERVAKAIYDRERTNRIRCLTWDGQDGLRRYPQTRENYLNMASAAIKAARYCKGRMSDPLEVGIDAALSHDEVKG